MEGGGVLRSEEDKNWISLSNYREQSLQICDREKLLNTNYCDRGGGVLRCESKGIKEMAAGGRGKKAGIGD